MNKYNISKLNRKTYLLLVVVFIALICIIIAISESQEFVKDYQFPLETEDIENVLTEQNLDWHIIDRSPVNDSRYMYTLKNDKNITIGVDAWVKDNHKILSMSWFLPSNLATEEVDNFLKNELSKHLKLPGIFYGNNRGLNKSLDEMLSYYFDEKNYANGIYWNKRVGNDHLKAQIRHASGVLRYQYITLIIIPNEEYEDYLKASEKAWKEANLSENIKIFASTVAEIKESSNEYISPVDDIDVFSKRFIVNGSLEDIKENKKIPELLININSQFLKPNKDKYLNAKLVDKTGSINVFIQMTSLNKKELNMKRNNNVLMLYNNNEPIYVVSPGALASE